MRPCSRAHRKETHPRTHNMLPDAEQPPASSMPITSMEGEGRDIAHAPREAKKQLSPSSLHLLSFYSERLSVRVPAWTPPAAPRIVHARTHAHDRACMQASPWKQARGHMATTTRVWMHLLL